MIFLALINAVLCALNVALFVAFENPVNLAAGVLSGLVVLICLAVAR